MTLGVDLIEVLRIEKFVDSKTLSQLLRVFTKREIDYSYASQNKYQRFAVRFSVKESFFKAFGMGFFSEIELLHDEKGKPFIFLHGKTKKKWEQQGCPMILVSVSHTHHYATSTVIIG